MKTIHHQNEVQFTRVQLEWLDKLFFENISENATHDDLLRNQGKRIVIAKVRSLVELSERKGVI